MEAAIKVLFLERTLDSRLCSPKFEFFLMFRSFRRSYVLKLCGSSSGSSCRKAVMLDKKAYLWSINYILKCYGVSSLLVDNGLIACYVDENAIFESY